MPRMNDLYPDYADDELDLLGYPKKKLEPYKPPVPDHVRIKELEMSVKQLGSTVMQLHQSLTSIVGAMKETSAVIQAQSTHIAELKAQMSDLMYKQILQAEKATKHSPLSLQDTVSLEEFIGQYDYAGDLYGTSNPYKGTKNPAAEIPLYDGNYSSNIKMKTFNDFVKEAAPSVKEEEKQVTDVPPPSRKMNL